MPTPKSLCHDVDDMCKTDTVIYGRVLIIRNTACIDAVYDVVAAADRTIHPRPTYSRAIVYTATAHLLPHADADR